MCVCVCLCVFVCLCVCMCVCVCVRAYYQWVRHTVAAKSHLRGGVCVSKCIGRPLCAEGFFCAVASNMREATRGRKKLRRAIARAFGVRAQGSG